jgi:serine phosphatase RsbU (regulator of sigma subunit)/pSer/pThr/pTyr-binding forkhead associated (FHA) protein
MELLISAPEGPPVKIDLGEQALTLGRSADNHLAYPDDPWLSRFHLSFELQDGGWWVKDCGSRNGTILNAAAVEAPRRIKAGDRIYAGHLTIDVREPLSDVKRPVISFVSKEDGRITREATITTSLERFLSTGERPTPTLNNGRVVAALIKAGQELALHRSMEGLFQVILDLALSAVEAKRGVIMTVEENGDLLLRASRGDGFSISTAVRDKLVRHRTSLLIGDTQADEDLRQQQSIVMHQVRSIVAVPLQTGDRVIGLIYVDNGALVRHFGQEDLDLLTVMANVAAIRIEHARLAEVEQSEKILEMELSQASELQQALLPQEAPHYDGYDLAGVNICCRTVGGDYYDFLPYKDGRMGVVVGDVSGKGMAAALLMSSLQARVQMLRETVSEPDQAVATLNRNISERCPPGKFITFFFGLLNGENGTLRYSNAGHNYPIVMRNNGTVEQLQGNGLVMGMFPVVRYELRETRLERGELLALYSDGVSEATEASDDSEFGEEGLSAFLRAHQSESCKDIVHGLVEHVRAWHGSNSFADDFTLLLVKRL